MKTIITKQSNGLDIIVGFGNPAPDPIETRKKVTSLLSKTEIGKKILAKEAEKNEIAIAGNEALKKTRESLMKRDQKQADIDYDEVLSLQRQNKIKESELQSMHPELEKLRLKLYETDAIYFEPKKGEFMIEVKAFEFASKDFKTLKEGECLSFERVEGKADVIRTVPNLIGQEFWIKNNRWELHKIEMVNVIVPEIGILPEDLTDAQKEEIELQFETERVSKLTIAEKQSEFEKLVDLLGDQAVALESKLKIQKDPDPLGASQVWYEAELVEAKSLYGL